MSTCRYLLISQKKCRDTSFILWSINKSPRLGRLYLGNLLNERKRPRFQSTNGSEIIKAISTWWISLAVCASISSRTEIWLSHRDFFFRSSIYLKGIYHRKLQDIIKIQRTTWGVFDLHWIIKYQPRDRRCWIRSLCWKRNYIFNAYPVK